MLRKEKRQRRGDDCEMRKEKTEFHWAQAGGAERTGQQAARPSIYTQLRRAPGSSRPSAPRADAPITRGEEGQCAEGSRAKPLCEAVRGDGGRAPLRRIFSYRKHS